MKRLSITSLASVLLFAANPALSQTTAPTTAPVEAVWQITVTEVTGVAQGRQSPDQQWVALTVGMTLPRSGTMRIGPRSSLVVMTPESKEFVINRTATVELEREFFPPRDPTDSIARGPSPAVRVEPSIYGTPKDPVFTPRTMIRPTDSVAEQNLHPGLRVRSVPFEIPDLPPSGAAIGPFRRSIPRAATTRPTTAP